MSDTVVELLDVNGEWWNLTTGDRGVWLGSGLKGSFYDPPVKVVYEEPGNYPGSRYLNHRILRRDITFAVEILNDRNESWLNRDSEWRKAWAFDRDCKLVVTTQESGTRYLKCRLGESPEVSMIVDPKTKNLNTAIMIIVAGDPFWYEDDVEYTAETELDTRFDPAPLPWPWPQAALPSEVLHIKVDPSDGKGGLNPTDQPVFLKWIVPGSQEPTSMPYIPWLPWLGAPDSPATTWILPDYSFTDEKYANRRLRLPGLIGPMRTGEIQMIEITGSPTGGTFVLDVGGVSTDDLPYNCSAMTMQTALESIGSIGPGNVTVTKSGNKFQAVFDNELIGVDVPTMIPRPALTGGTYPYVNVTVKLEGSTTGSEDCVVDTDPRVEQVSSDTGSQVWSRMNGVRFRNPVPPYTKSKDFEITVSGCAPGQIVTLRIPRPWTRPWGLE